MNKLKVMFLIAAISVLATLASATLLEGFNYASDAEATTGWVIGGNDLTTNTATMVISRETSIVAEGTSSLRLVYSYKGNQWYEAAITKIFPTPQNWGIYNKYKFNFYNSNAGDSTRLMFYFRLYTDSGYAYRYATYSGFAYPGWHEFTVDLAMMSTDAWVYNAGQYGSCPNLSSVTAFQFLIQQQTGIASGGVSTTYIDNWRGFTKSNLSIGTTLMDFNYASVDTLTADWKANPSTAGTTSIALSTTSFFGDKSLDLYSNLTYYWTNIGYTHSIPTTDMSGIKYFKVWMYGDPAANTTANPLFLFTLQDANLSQAWAKVAMVALSHPEWQAVYMPLYVGDTAGGYNTFIQNTWDPGRATTSIDLSKIIAIQLLEQTGSNGYPAVYHTYFDEIDFGWATAIPFIMTPNTLSVRPSSSAVPVTVYSGVGPYTWAIDPGLGTLSATTGTSVNFTPGSFVTSGNIYIYDATGETATVPVAIAATAAPMAPESFYHPSLSSKMGKDWSLFE